LLLLLSESNIVLFSDCGKRLENQDEEKSVEEREREREREKKEKTKYN
jgi:hypothetical protein